MATKDFFVQTTHGFTNYLKQDLTNYGASGHSELLQKLENETLKSTTRVDVLGRTSSASFYKRQFECGLGQLPILNTVTVHL